MKLPKTAITLCLLVSLSCLRPNTQGLNADSPILIFLGILQALSNAPTFDPAPGTFATTQTITINHRNKVPVRYTLDGTTTPSCTVGQVYDETNKLTIPLGKYTLQAVECFEGFSSTLGRGDYSITGTFSYVGLFNGSLFFTIGSTISYSPTGLDSAGVYRFTVTPVLPTCITLNANTGVLAGTCSTPQVGTSYRFTAARQNGNKEDLIANINLTVAQWNNEAYLKAPNAEGGDQFGGNLALSGDTIAVGARQEGSAETTITNGTTNAGNGALSSGAVYVFRRTGNTWTNEAYIKAPNAEGGDLFGSGVVISGDTIAVTATSDDSVQTTITNGTLVQGTDTPTVNTGAAYVFRRTGTTWANEAYLKAPNAETGDLLGSSIAISGDTIVVSTTSEDSLQTTITNGTLVQGADTSTVNAGAAYVFRRTGTTWANEAYLKAPNAETTDQFGHAVSISGDTIVVSTIREDSSQTTITNGTTSAGNGATDSGAVYVFRRTGNTWANEAYLKAPNAETGDSFGFSVGIDGDTIVVGAVLEDSLETTITNGTISQASDTGTNFDVGAAYVFRRTGSTWANEAYLKAPNAEQNDSFGRTVAISANTILVGAQSEDSNQTTITNGTLVQASDVANNLSVGAVYVFRRTGTTWVNEAYLKAPNAEQNDQFGSGFGPLAVSGDTIVVGVTFEDSLQTTITNGTLVQASDFASNNSVGAAYVFRLR